ncbi:MAG: helicase [Hyphomicrobiales bacterium]|nr:helicase [Hyphomicrobiales bacterium]
MPFPATNPSLERALADKGYAEPTPVQAAVLQPEAAGRDLLVSAQTGSGKTVAYGLALASTLLGEEERFGAPGEPLALIIAPTRELALQVQRELVWLYGPAGARVTSCVGGMDVRREARALADGCHVVVATPGRLRDHLERGRLDTSSLRAVVLDEADEMLDLGFREDLEFILDAVPEERRTLLFSATIPRDIAALARRFQNDAFRIDTVDQSQPHGDIEYRAIRIAPNEIEHACVNVLRLFEARGAMIFCHTREAVRHLHASLQERGFNVVALSGELSQTERTHALQALRDGRARVCVATDVAARGIDLPDLGLVIHAELPNDRDTLLHRSGRTGRAGRKGVCVILVPYTRRRKAEGLLAQARVDATWGSPPTAEEIRAADQVRMIEDPAFSEPTTEEDLAMAQTLLAGRTPEEIAAVLVRLYRARLPAPEELFEAGAAPERAPRERRERVTSDLREQRPERAPRERAGTSFDRSPQERGSYDKPPHERPQRERTSHDRPTGPMVWFRMNVGRRNQADPRWLLPIICRMGHVTKSDLGTIRIFDRETKFEVTEAVAAKFAGAVRRSTNDENITIEPAHPGTVVTTEAVKPERVKYEGGKPERPKHEEPEHSPAPEAEARSHDKPKFDKPKFDKPKYDKPKHDGPKPERRPYEGSKPRYEPLDNSPVAKAPDAAPAPYKKPYDKPKYEGGKPGGFPKKGGYDAAKRKPDGFKPGGDKPFTRKAPKGP